MLDEKTLQTLSAPRSPVAESFRVTRTNIEFSSVDKEIRTMVITSSTKGEGKTTTASNLAVTFAQLGRRVLLVDTDFRRPMIHRVFGVDNRTGLTTTLLKHGNPLEYVRTTAVPGLSVLTSGPIPPNPAELLMTGTMKDFIDHVRTQFDHVLFDTPPVTIVTDAAIMATKVDGTILVVRSGAVDRRLLKRCKELLDQVKANLLGVVVNGINRENEAYYYQYYYYSYYGEGQPTSKRRKHRRRKKRSPAETVPIVREPQGIRSDIGQNEPPPPPPTKS